MDDDDAQQHYIAGWSDFRAIAIALLTQERLHELAEYLRNVPLLPSGDK